MLIITDVSPRYPIHARNGNHVFRVRDKLGTVTNIAIPDWCLSSPNFDLYATLESEFMRAKAPA